MRQKQWIPILTALSLLYLSTGASAETGYSFDVTLSETKKGKTQAPIVFRTQISGEKGRVDITEDKEEWKKGDYLITTDGGKTFTLVSPGRKTLKAFTPTSLKADIEKENRGISVEDPAITYTTVSPGQERLDRSYKLSFRQGFITGRGTIAETHEYTLRPAETTGPSYNPFINFNLMEVAALLLKNRSFENRGIHSVLPKGFVSKAVIRLKMEMKASMMGERKEESSVTFDSSTPVAGDVAESTFTVPTDYKPAR